MDLLSRIFLFIQKVGRGGGEESALEAGWPSGRFVALVLKKKKKDLSVRVPSYREIP